jgi:hypothetical protein
MNQGFKAPPIKGYQDVSGSKQGLVNENKDMEECLLRHVEALMSAGDADQKRWCAIAKTHFEQGFMALNRAVFNPKRIKLPGDPE